MNLKRFVQENVHVRISSVDYCHEVSIHRKTKIKVRSMVTKFKSL